MFVVYREGYVVWLGWPRYALSREHDDATHWYTWKGALRVREIVGGIIEECPCTMADRVGHGTVRLIRTAVTAGLAALLLWVGAAEAAGPVRGYTSIPATPPGGAPKVIVIIPPPVYYPPPSSTIIIQPGRPGEAPRSTVCNFITGVGLVCAR